MRILNLYSGIGGNRKDWGDDFHITAVEKDELIAKIYQDFFPNDKIIVGDAHEYLLKNFKEFNFIWSSPPCPSHSRTNYFLKARGVYRYPDMALYQEIIFLEHFFSGQYCVENVISYYNPLIQPQEIARHYFWSNFYIPPFISDVQIGRMCGDGQVERRKQLLRKSAFNLDKYDVPEKDRLLRNCVNPELGLHILNAAFQTKNNLLAAIEAEAKQEFLFN